MLVEKLGDAARGKKMTNGVVSSLFGMMLDRNHEYDFVKQKEKFLRHHLSPLEDVVHGENDVRPARI